MSYRKHRGRNPTWKGDHTKQERRIMSEDPQVSHFSAAVDGRDAPVGPGETRDDGAAETHPVPLSSPGAEPGGSNAYQTVTTSGGVTVIQHGPITDDVRDHRIWFHVFPCRFAKSGREFSGTVGHLIPFLTAYEEGQKDGTAIVGGVKRGDRWYGHPLPPGVKRTFPHATRDRLKDAALTRMTMVCLDLDKGDDGAEIVKRVKELGFFAILAPSYSHLSVTETDVSHEKLTAHSEHDAPFTLEEVRAFLVRVEGFNPIVFDGAEVVGVFEPKKGKPVTRVRHTPLQKYRLIVPLAAPWYVPEGVTEKEAREPWGALMRGLAHSLGVVLDESTTDLQRLFFVPRRPAGREVTAHVIGGTLLEWQTIDPVEKPADKPRAKGARRSLAEGSDRMKTRAVDRGVDGWINAHVFNDPTIPGRLKQRRRTFNMVSLMLSQGFEVRDGKPEKGGWISFRCPNAEAHSEADTPTHTAFYCAAPNESYPSQAMCFHDHCRSFGVAEFVDLLLKDQEAARG